MDKKQRPEFTEEEDYYRTYLLSTQSKPRIHFAAGDLGFALISLICLWFYHWIPDDGAFGLMAYGLLLFRLVQSAYGTYAYGPILAGLIRKYEDRLHADNCVEGDDADRP